VDRLALNPKHTIPEISKSLEPKWCDLERRRFEPSRAPLCKAIRGGIAPHISLPPDGKPEAYRSVLRQSRTVMGPHPAKQLFALTLMIRSNITVF